MKNIWITADQHFGHANIIKYADRPYGSIHEMNKDLIARTNEVVREDDLLIIAGDFCFPRHADPTVFLKRLNGRKILIKGNHDKNKTLKAFDEWYHNYPIIIDTYCCIINHRPVYPPGTPDPYRDHDTSIDISKYDFVLCGHTHDHEHWKRDSPEWKCLNIGVDANNYYPLHVDEIKKLLDARVIHNKNYKGFDK